MCIDLAWLLKDERRADVSLSYSVKSQSASNNKYKQDDIIFYQQHICPIWWTSVSTEDWYS